MAVSVTLQKVTKSAGGRFYVRYSDGSEYEFGSLAELKEWAQALDQDPSIAQRMLAAWWLARDANATNTKLGEGKTLTFDLSVASSIKVQ